MTHTADTHTEQDRTGQNISGPWAGHFVAANKWKNWELFPFSQINQIHILTDIKSNPDEEDLETKNIAD